MAEGGQRSSLHRSLRREAEKMLHINRIGRTGDGMHRDQQRAPKLKAYHFTTTDNLNSIVACGHLIPRRHLSVDRDDIADRRALQERENLGLDHLVPMYLMAVPPMWVKLLATGQIPLARVAVLEFSIMVLDSYGLSSIFVARNETTLRWQHISRSQAGNLLAINASQTPWYLIGDRARRHRRMLGAQLEVALGPYVPVAAATRRGPLATDTFGDILRMVELAVTLRRLRR